MQKNSYNNSDHFQILDHEEGKQQQDIILSQHSQKSSQSGQFQLIIENKGSNKQNQEMKKQIICEQKINKEKQIINNPGSQELYNLIQWQTYLQHPTQITSITINSILHLNRQSPQIRLLFWEKIIKINNIKVQWEYKPTTNLKEKKAIIKHIQKIKLIFKQLGYDQSTCYYYGSWIENTLIQYAGIDIQIGYSKGLQYICMGILVSHPKPTQMILKNYFLYFMHGLGLRRLFLPGSPLFFIELQYLQQTLNQKCIKLNKKILQANADTTKIFISYFKAILLYKCQNKQSIETIFSLILIYGVKLIRTILSKILILNQQKYIKMQTDQFLSYLGNNIVKDYLQNKVIDKLRILLIN